MPFSWNLLVISFLPEKIAALASTLQFLPDPPQIWVFDTPSVAPDLPDHNPTVANPNKNFELHQNISIISLAQPSVPSTPICFLPIQLCEEKSWQDFLQSEFYRCNPLFKQTDEMLILTHPGLHPDGTTHKILDILYRLKILDKKMMVLCEMNDELSYRILKQHEVVALSHNRTWAVTALTVIQRHHFKQGCADITNFLETGQGHWPIWTTSHFHYPPLPQLFWTYLFISMMLGIALGLALSQLFS